MINYTEKAIHDTFVQILKETNYGKLTVKNMTDRCEISRNTFYYYYDSIQSLMEAVLKEWLAPVGEDRELNGLYDSVASLVSNCLAYRREILRIFHSVYKTILMRDIETFVKHGAARFVREKQQNHPFYEKDRKTLVSFYEHVLMGFFMYWLHDGMNYDIRSFTSVLDVFFRRAPLRKERMNLNRRRKARAAGIMDKENKAGMNGHTPACDAIS